jgi:ABC-type antimicrobial peptide transport system permease subunit
MAVGLVVAVLAAHSLTSMMLFSFGPIGVWPFVAVSVLLIVATMLGAYIPARRASRIDPMQALRDE